MLVFFKNIISLLLNLIISSDSVDRQKIQEALERILEVKYFLIQYKEKVEGSFFNLSIFTLNTYQS